ncbi:MAG: hypothetical protein KIT87_23385 [Anaerolineae bacterium]|nr:hypothetical protein [Anaerolineae bacterium]
MLKRPAPARWLALVLALACMIPFLLNVIPVAAQTNGVDLPPLTLRPGQSVTLSIRALCIQYTMPFPRDFPPIAGLADPKYVQIVRYALSKGYVDSDPYQVQLALWRAQTGQWVNTYMRARAEEIFNNANQAPPPPPGAGPSLVDAIQANTVQVSYQQWTPVQNGLPDSDQPWLATGEIVVRNPGTASLTLSLPQGLFLDAPGQTQDMILIFTPTQPQATTTPATSSTPLVTATRPAVTPTGAPGTPSPQATPRATPRLPHSGMDKPDDPGYLILVLGGLLFVAGLAVDLARRYQLASAGHKKTPRQF